MELIFIQILDMVSNEEDALGHSLSAKVALSPMSNTLIATRCWLRYICCQLMEGYWCHDVQKSAYPNCSGALTNCSGRRITIPEDLINAPEHLPTAPERSVNTFVTDP